VAHGAAQQQRRLADLEVLLWTPTAVDRDRALARDHVRGRVASAMRHPLPVVLGPEDQAAVRRLRDAYDSYQHATAASRHRELVPDRFVDMMALAGTPDEVREQVRQALPSLERSTALTPAGRRFTAGMRATADRLFADVLPAATVRRAEEAVIRNREAWHRRNAADLGPVS